MRCVRFLLGVVSALAACEGGQAQGGSAAPLRDDLGQPVTLEHRATRIVSLSPSITELLFDIGAAGAVVGRTRWCDYPPAALDVPSVGDGLNPNVELIVARRPDLVLFYASPSNAAAIERLRGLGIASASIRLDKLEDVPRAARWLSSLAGDSARASRLAGDFARRLDSARAAPGGPTQRVALVVWDNPPIVIGAGSFLTELLALAGARNVFDDISAASAPVSIEEIATRDPDALVMLGTSDPPALAGRPEWQVVRAVRTRHFVAVAGSEFERPSFRSLDAARQMGRALAMRSPQ